MSDGKKPQQVAVHADDWLQRVCCRPCRGSGWRRRSAGTEARASAGPCQRLDIALKRQRSAAPRNGGCARIRVVGKKSNDRLSSDRSRSDEFLQQQAVERSGARRSGVRAVGEGTRRHLAALRPRCGHRARNSCQPSTAAASSAIRNQLRLPAIAASSSTPRPAAAPSVMNSTTHSASPARLSGAKRGQG